MSEKSYSDIQTKMWFDRLLPRRVYPYARLARWDRPVGVWLLFLPCLWGMFFIADRVTITVFEFLGLILLFFIGSVVMRGAGCVINDLWDQKLDAQVERTQNRPLASGQLSQQQALIFLFLQLFIGAIILFSFNAITIFIGLLSLPLIIFYPLMKRWTWWPQAFLGITFNWGILMGASAVYGGLTAGIFWLYGGAIFWTLAYDTIYAFQDIDDDAMIGIRSTAQLFGNKTMPILTLFYLLMGVCFLQAGQNVSAPIIYFILIISLVAGHLFALYRLWDRTDQQSCLTAFKRHILFGWMMVAIMMVKFLLTVYPIQGTMTPP